MHYTREPGCFGCFPLPIKLLKIERNVPMANHLRPVKMVSFGMIIKKQGLQCGIRETYIFLASYKKSANATNLNTFSICANEFGP